MSRHKNRAGEVEGQSRGSMGQDANYDHYRSNAYLPNDDTDVASKAHNHKNSVSGASNNGRQYRRDVVGSATKQLA